MPAKTDPPSNDLPSFESRCGDAYLKTLRLGREFISLLEAEFERKPQTLQQQLQEIDERIAIETNYIDNYDLNLYNGESAAGASVPAEDVDYIEVEAEGETEELNFDEPDFNRLCDYADEQHDLCSDDDD